ncbi:MAG: hypothetical protein GEV10_15225 [Streptosporangiales bacterium]|nr:hypothetical protein [Streptosporangiales bacterium]
MAANSRNGTTLKTVASEVGLDMPHDRDATFEPRLVPKDRLGGLCAAGAQPEGRRGHPGAGTAQPRAGRSARQRRAAPPGHLDQPLPRRTRGRDAGRSWTAGRGRAAGRRVASGGDGAPAGRVVASARRGYRAAQGAGVPPIHH